MSDNQHGADYEAIRGLGRSLGLKSTAAYELLYTTLLSIQSLEQESGVPLKDMSQEELLELVLTETRKKQTGLRWFQ